MKNSHLQDLNKIIAILIAILVISIPVNAQELIKTETSAEDTKEIITGGEFTEFALIAKEYAPKILRSSLIEQQNVPVEIHLTAIPTDPTLTFPRIQPPLIVKEISNKTYLAGGITYHEPNLFSWDDIGYLEVRLKRIPKEEDVPENIKTTLKISINYEAESAPGQISGTELKTLDYKRGLTIDDVLGEEDYMFFGGRGYVSVNSISSRSASFQIYDETGKPLKTISSTTGKSSSEIRLIKESEDPMNVVRIKVNKINDFSKNNLKIIIDNQEKIINKGAKIRSWIVKDIIMDEKTKKEYAILYKSRVGEVYLSKQLNIYSNIETMRKIYPKITSKEFEEMKKRLQALEIDWPDFEILEFNKGEQTRAILNIGGITKQVNENEKIGVDCQVTNIGQNSMRIRYRTGIKQKDGTERKVEQNVVLTLPEYQQDGYYEIEERVENYLPSNYCGEKIELQNIDFKKSVEFQVMSGTRRGSTETTLDINIPIEKKPFELSPRQIDRLINKTQKQIDYLDEKIEKLEKTVTQWRKICLLTMATITILNFLTGYKPAITEQEAKQREKRKNKLAEMEDGTKVEQVEQKEKTQGCGKGYWLVKEFSASSTENKSVYTAGERNYGVYYTEETTKAIFGKKKINDKIKDIEISPEKTVCKPIDNSILYKYDGKAKKWNPYIYTKNHEFVLYNGLDPKELTQVKTAIIKGEKVVIVPLKDQHALPGKVKAQFEQWKPAHFGDKLGLYAVFSDNRLDFYQGFGKIDGGVKLEENDIADRFIGGGYSPKDREYIIFEKVYIQKIRTAQTKGFETIEIGSNVYKVNPTITELSTESIKCRQVMSDAECKLLYNACDPVMCPPSRCTLGGKYKVPSVIKSGLIGSIVLCLPNIKEGVLVPVCLTGILASLKNIRSYLKTYVQCLKVKKLEGKSIGICERVRSVYMCQIIWKEIMPIVLQLGKGLLSTVVGSDEGSEYGSGVEGRLSQGQKTIDFFTRDYATEIFAAYRAKTTEQIGVELCKASIGGSLPNFGEILDEIAAPEDPVQYFAWIEEHEHSVTKSSYQLYYHIYAGTPKNKQVLNYQILLRAKNKKPIMVGQGTLKSGQEIDENIETIQDKGYNEVCVIAGGPMQCGFGKIISTSFGMQQLFDEIAGTSAGKKIEKTEDCVSGTTPVIETLGIELQLQQIPRPAVNRKCSTSNPFLGLGQKKEGEWKIVGQCIDEDGTNRGRCWAKLDAQNYPEIEEIAGEASCTGDNLELCEKYQRCINGGTVIEDFSGRQCCQNGKCENVFNEALPEYSNIKAKINEAGALDASQKKSLTEYVEFAEKNNGKFPIGDNQLIEEIEILKENPETRDTTYLIIGLTHIKYSDYDKAEQSFKRISDQTIRKKAGDIIINIYNALQYWEKVISVCEQYMPEEKHCAENARSFKEEKTIVQKIKSAGSCEKAKQLAEQANIINEKIQAQAFFELGKKCLDEKNYQKAGGFLQQSTVTLSRVPDLSSKLREYEYYEYLAEAGYLVNSKENIDIRYLIEDLNELLKNDMSFDIKEKIQNLKKFLEIYGSENKDQKINQYNELKQKANVDSYLAVLIDAELKKQGCTSDDNCKNNQYEKKCHKGKGICVQCVVPLDCRALFQASPVKWDCKEFKCIEK